MSNVVSLTDRRARRSSVICPDLDLRFPQLFRVTIDPAGVIDPAARQLLGDRPMVTYTLGCPLADIAGPLRPGCRVQAIDRLNPEIDWPAVTVRHHVCEARAHTYSDGLTDAGLSESQVDVTWVENEVYTIFRHIAPPAGQPPYTLAFMAAVDDDDGGTYWQHFVPR